MSVSIGQEVFFLTVRTYLGKRKIGRGEYKFYECECVCGKFVELREASIGRDNKSCGCYKSKLMKESHWQGTTHQSRVGHEHGSFRVTEYLGKRQVPSGLFHNYRVECIHCHVTSERLSINFRVLRTCRCERRKTMELRKAQKREEIQEARKVREAKKVEREELLKAKRAKALESRITWREGEETIESLTLRQFQLMEFRRQGLSHRQIAVRFGIRADTVKKAIRDIRDKMLAPAE